MTDELIDSRIEHTIAWFSTIYLGGIPSIVTHDASFLSFICILTGTEALAGYRYGAEEPNSGERFNLFIRTYFPPEYHPFTERANRFRNGRLWLFRCRLVDGLSPAGVLVIHHHSERHLSVADNGNPVLNAEDFYAAFLNAAQSYFREVRADKKLQKLFIARLDDSEHGGPIAVGPVRVTP